MVMKQTYLTTRTGPRRVLWETLKIHSLIVADHHGPSPLLAPSRASMPSEMAVKIGQISVCSNLLIVTSLIMDAQVAGLLRVSLTLPSMA